MWVLSSTANALHIYKFMENEYKSLIKAVEHTLRESWRKPAFTDYGTDRSYTYGEVAQRIAQHHLWFESQGIRRGDKIAICDKNCSNWGVGLLAILTYGAVAVPFLPDFSTSQLQEMCQHSESRLMLTSRDVDEVGERVAEEYARRYPDGFLAEHVSYAEEDPDDLMLLSYTSGSTGRPKGVMLPYRAMWSNNKFAYEVLPVGPDARVLVILPMAHMYGFAFDFMYGVTCASHLFILTKLPAPKIILEAFATIRPDFFLCVPLVMEKIIKAKVIPVLRKPMMRVLTAIPGIRHLIYRKIRQQLTEALGGRFYEIIMGGAALNREVEKVLYDIGLRYTVGYGMTECAPIITYCDWRVVRLGSCGKAAPRMEVKVLSSDPQHVAGEIVCRGANVMTGYYKDPKATAEAIDADGWLHTGDLGVIDADGFVYIRGRKKNMLLSSNGQNIYPEEAEDQVVTYSIFDECVVVQRNDHLVGLVYATDLTLRAQGLTRAQVNEQLQAICRDINHHLPKYCQIHHLEQREEEFEKTPKRSIKRFLYS